MSIRSAATASLQHFCFTQYLCFLGLKVAVKSIRKARIADLREIERIDSEIKLLTMVKHDNIVRLLEVFHTSVHINLVMEYVRGGSLEEFIAENQPLTEVNKTQ